MSAVMTLVQLANRVDVDQLVGTKPSNRWGRASLTTPRADGYSIAGWFETHPAKERIDLVREALVNGTPWAPLLRARLPKTPPSTETRAVDMPVVLDQARIYILNDWLAAYAETVLTRVAVAFRRGTRMSNVIMNAHRRMKRLPFASVIDIASFFDSIPWTVAEGAVEKLLADGNVKAFLKSLIHVQVVESRSGNLVKRVRGIPQGLSCSPVIANLVLREFDEEVAHALSRTGVTVRRYCDDILIQGPSLAATRQAVTIIGRRLAKLGLSVKAGTGHLVDTRMEPFTWLGIAFGPDGLRVPPDVTKRKVVELQGRFNFGNMSIEGVEASLISLSNYYERTVGPGEAMAMVSSIRTGLDLPNSRYVTRKEDIHHLRHLTGNRSHRGSPPIAADGNSRTMER